jgi:hypothetical protein
MTTKTIKIFEKSEKGQGFSFQEGFAALMDDSRILAAASGYETDNGNGGSWGVYVYRPDAENPGEWLGGWEDGEDALTLSDAISDWQDEKELKKALTYAAGKKLHTAEGDIFFTDVVPGEKCNNGGEYGFYTRYSPILEHPGIYRVSTETTCDFDACGTGYEGIRALTTGEYRRLKKASDKIEAAGSLY